MWKYLIADYLSFTKKDRNGIFVLLSLILLFIILPFLFPFFIKEKTYDHSAFEKDIASLEMKQADSSGSFEGYADKRKPRDYNSSSTDNNYSNQIKGELFYFDPNLASVQDWKRLGLRDKTIATIQNYLSKGGKFYKKEDISKIWGLHKDEVDRLMPYVQITASKTVNNYAVATSFEKKEYKKETFKPLTVNVNRADTAALIALPGIGSKLSQRIINFRDKLGGFYKVEQVGETFGLPDSTFQKIKGYLQINSGEIATININTAPVELMKSHPYLRYAIANAIVQYRTQHGNYAAVTDIKKIMIVSEEAFNKVAPYLAVQ